MQMLNDPKGFKCSDCGKVFKDDAKFWTHPCGVKEASTLFDQDEEDVLKLLKKAIHTKEIYDKLDKVE